MTDCPTVAELVHLGLAQPDPTVRKGDTRRFRVTDEGHALMGERLRANGKEARDARE